MARADQASDMQKGAAGELKVRVPDAMVDFHPLLRSPRWIHSANGFLTGPKGQGRGVGLGSARQFAENDPDRPIKAFLQEHKSLFGHGTEVIQDAKRTRDYVHGAKKVRTVVWEQQLDGINVYDSVFIAHITGQGELISVSSQFVPDLGKAAEKGHKNRKALQKKPSVSAREALVSAIKAIQENVPDGEIVQSSADATPELKHQFKAGKLPGKAEARLVWLPLDSTEIRLCWQVEVTRRTLSERFLVLVDAETGEVLLRRCLTFDFRDVTYRVFAGESPSPFSPALSSPSDYQPPVVPRQLLTLGAISSNASPVGWIPDAGNETRGNNVDAHLDRDADDTPDLPRPQGNPFRVFDYPLDLAQHPTNYSQAAAVQLFYWCNWAHDKLYDLGFTEASGNFQKDNFGRGGLGNDAVLADAQDASGFNNANFTPTRDGSPPRIQMFLFNGPNPWRDGDLDATVILHEYVHGLTDRMVGGGMGFSQGDQPYGLAEGWSDFYAAALLSKPEDDPDGTYLSGGYLSYRYAELRNNYYFGIRRYPYSTDMTKNPLTFRHIYYDDIVGNTNVPRNPIITGTGVEVHRMGEVWCMALWEARAKLIEKVGSVSAGNQLMLDLVTEALPLTVQNPNFIQARDAILKADQVHHESTNRNALWAGFAKRGMGYSASTWELPLIGADVREAFDVPGALAIQLSGTFISGGPVGGPFSPTSANWTLRNRGEYDFAWSAQPSTNWLDINPPNGRLATNSAIDITVSINANANLLAKGSYSNMVRFFNITAGQVVTQWVYLQVDEGVILSGGMWQNRTNVAFAAYTFTLDSLTNVYSICKFPANNFPTDPAGGEPLVLVDDSYRLVTLSNDMEISIYNVRSNKFFIGSNGDIVFSPPAGYTTNSEPDFYTEYFHPDRFFDHFRAAPFYADLNPAEGGTVSLRQLPDRVAVTYQNVREFLVANSNSFQIELFTNGTIRYTYLALQVSDVDYYNVQIGFSRGLGAVNYTTTDLAASPSCFSYDLNVPAQAKEGDGVLQGSILLALPVSKDSEFKLASSDTNMVFVETVIVPANQTSATFPIVIRDDNLLNGTRVVTITAHSDDYDPSTASMTVTDNESASLYVGLPPSATEGQGLLPSAGLVGVSARPDAAIGIRLVSSHPELVKVPEMVTIESNQDSTNFDVEILDDLLMNDARRVIIQATVENWGGASNALEVVDNESREIELVLPPRLAQTTSRHFNAGVVHFSGLLTSNLAVQLASDSPGVLSVPEMLVVPAGTNMGAFDIDVIDNQQTIDLVVSVSASAFGFASATGSVAVGGVDVPSAPASPTPVDNATKIPMQGTVLQWSTAQAEPPGSIVFEVYFGTNSIPGIEEYLGTTTNGFWSLSQKLLFSKTYYWQVVATRGPHRVAGPVWRFNTVRLSYFEVSEVQSPQRLRVPFELTVTAKDEHLETAEDFEGPAMIEGVSPTVQHAILISEVDIGTTPRIEFINVSGHDIEISGWQISLYDWVSWPVPRTTFTIPGRVMCAAGELFVLNRSVIGNFPGNYPNFMLGTNLGWTVLTIGNPIAVLLRDNSGKVIDFMCAADAVPSQIIVPTPIAAEQWQGPPVAASLISNRSYQRQGFTDRNLAADWLVGLTNINTRNPALSVPFASTREVAVLPSVLSNFVNGVWTGQASVGEAASSVALRVSDEHGHTGTNPLFAVVAFDNLTLTVTQPASVPRLGGTFAYGLAINNSGPAPATGVLLRDTIPPATEFVSAVSTHGSCSNVAGEVLCEIGTLESNATAQVTLTLRPSGVGFVTNNAWALRAEPFLPNHMQSITWIDYPWLSLSRTNVREGDTNMEFLFPVKLSNPSTLPVSVNYFTTEGTAREGMDFVGASGTLEFAPGETNVNIAVTILGNRLAESNKTFMLTLAEASNAVVASTPVLIIIVNDDNGFTSTVNISDALAQEGNDGTANAVFTVSLTQPLMKPLSVYYNTVDGTATANLDYVPSSGRLEIPAGVTNRTISISVLGDRLYESNETFQVRLNFADLAYIARNVGNGSIVDDDAGELNGFAWTLNGATQFANAPFPVTLRAVDALGRTLSGYNTIVSVRAGRQAQQLTLGSGTNLSFYPLGAGYQDQRLQALYLPGQIGRSGRITSLALRLYRPPGKVLSSWTIRLSHSGLTNFQSTQAWQEISEPAAYQTDESFAAGGWVTFNLQRPFDYDGTNSILVDYSFHNDLPSRDGLCWATTNADYRAIGFSSDGLYGAPLTWSGSSPAPIPFLLTPQIRFSIDSPLSVLPVPDSQHVNIYPPGDLLLINGVWTGHLALGCEPLAPALMAPDLRDVVLTAIDGAGNAGASSPLNFIQFQPLLQKVDAGLKLMFPTIPGQRYQVDGASELPSAGGWGDVSGMIEGTGAIYEAIYPVNEGRRFYRVKILY